MNTILVDTPILTPYFHYIHKIVPKSYNYQLAAPNYIRIENNGENNLIICTDGHRIHVVNTPLPRNFTEGYYYIEKAGKNFVLKEVENENPSFSLYSIKSRLNAKNDTLVPIMLNKSNKIEEQEQISIIFTDIIRRLPITTEFNYTINYKFLEDAIVYGLVMEAQIHEHHILISSKEYKAVLPFVQYPKEQEESKEGE